MRALPVAIIIVVLLAAACAPGPKANDPQAVETKAVDARAESAAAPSTTMGKRAPLQPGEQASPVIAFRGHAEHWNIQIENTGGYAHVVDFNWGSGSQHAVGRLQYQAQPGAVAGAPILLEGSLDTGAGRRAMRVDITPAACTDDADQAYPQSVRVGVEGMAPMLGCGELAK